MEWKNEWMYEKGEWLNDQRCKNTKDGQTNERMKNVLLQRQSSENTNKPT